jgi:hypothetical protein
MQRLLEPRTITGDELLPVLKEQAPPVAGKEANDDRLLVALSRQDLGHLYEVVAEGDSWDLTFCLGSLQDGGPDAPCLQPPLQLRCWTPGRPGSGC